MTRLRDNPLVQFSAVSVVVTALVASVVSFVLVTRLDRDVELLEQYETATEMGVAVMPAGPLISYINQDLISLRRLTYVGVGGGFLILYAGLIVIVWLARRAISRQQAQIESAQAGLEAREIEGVGSLREANERLHSEVDERWRAEAALRDSNERLRQAMEQLRDTQQQVAQQARMRALGQLASGIAHDFNNALSPILAYSELMLLVPENLDNKEEATGYLKIISTAAQDAAAVVKRLREFYRESDHSEVAESVSLNETIEQAISLTRPKWVDEAQAAGVKIDFQTDLGDIPLVVGNGSAMREALTNLVINAVDAMPQGGNITAATRVDGDHVVLEFSDTGMGMSEEVRQRCMDPFFSTKGEKGTGMGLAMVFGIMQRHHGTIDVQSEPGEGTTFVIRLPVDLTSSAVAETETFELPRVKALRILAVDDDPLGLKVLSDCLSVDGHSVDTASNGREGLERFRASTYDLVVTDRSMPEMNGDQLASAIKEAAPDNPVIMVTGFGDIMEASGDNPPGVDLVLTKPVSVTALRAALLKVSAAA